MKRLVEEAIRSLRYQIAEVDTHLVSLLRARASLSSAVAVAKVELGLPIHDPGREKELLDLLAPSPGPVREAYREIIRACREHSIRTQ